MAKKLPYQYTFLLSLVAVIALNGCGLVQRAATGAQTLFNRNISVLRLDFIMADSHSAAQYNNKPIVLRVWQLRDDKRFNALNFSQIVAESDALLKQDILARQDRIVNPNGRVSLDMPLEKETKYIAVAGLLNSPKSDIDEKKWQLIIKRNQLRTNGARQVVINQTSLQLLP